MIAYGEEKKPGHSLTGVNRGNHENEVNLVHPPIPPDRGRKSFSGQYFSTEAEGGKSCNTEERGATLEEEGALVSSSLTPCALKSSLRWANSHPDIEMVTP